MPTAPPNKHTRSKHRFSLKRSMHKNTQSTRRKVNTHAQKSKHKHGKSKQNTHTHTQKSEHKYAEANNTHAQRKANTHAQRNKHNHSEATDTRTKEANTGARRCRIRAPPSMAASPRNAGVFPGGIETQRPCERRRASLHGALPLNNARTSALAASGCRVRLLVTIWPHAACCARTRAS